MILAGYVAHIWKKSNTYRIVFVWDEMKEGDTVNI
jgi:hypothetical protein